MLKLSQARELGVFPSGTLAVERALAGIIWLHHVPHVRDRDGKAHGRSGGKGRKGATEEQNGEQLNLFDKRERVLSSTLSLSEQTRLCSERRKV